MGLLTKPADFTATTLTVVALNDLKNRIYDEFGSTSASGGDDQGEISDANISTTAAIDKTKIADTAVVCGNTVSAGTQTITRPLAVTGGLTSQAGTGSAAPTVLGVLHTDATVVGNVGAGEDDLMSYTMPANTLVALARGLRIVAWGSIANNANAKQLSMYFGADQPVDVALTTGAAYGWRIETYILRTTAGNFTSSGILWWGAGATISVGRVPLAETETAAIIIKCTGEAVADNDITQEGFVVEAI